ncbi:MAG: type secretion protein [Gammaproteobacteria bacterium]|nr:type secretion protein [Gammaproteobacteria bacterium]
MLLKNLLRNRAVLVALGLLLLALIIWFAGPYFAFGNAKPFETVVERLIAILVLVTLYALYVLLRQVRNAQHNQRFAEEVSKQAGATSDVEGTRVASGEAAQLSKRFDEALQALKTRRNGAGLYDLPWYMIIGPPGAGKTTVLVNSGLNFPLAQKFGKEALRGVGGTRSCDWWFTDQAVLLDTAGRYTTQDSNQAADAAGWTAFLQLLRKHRPRQPINGVIVAMSAAELLTLDEQGREQHSRAIRERLDELGRDLRIEFPVYFLVTKCDLVAGFTPLFDELGEDARSQVWGATFALNVTESGQAAESFTGEFDRLLERLQQRVMPRMQAERDPARRLAVLAFPQQMALLKPILGDLLKQVFGASRFDHKVLLRGVYFTSGTQEGTPIDRLLGSIARSFGFESAVAPPGASAGRAYFIERLLKRVIFQEAGLAGVNRKLQLRKLALHSAAYIGCGIVLLLGVLGLLVSYSANASYIDDVTRAAADLKSTELGAGTAGLPLETFLPRLDVLRTVTDSAEKYKADIPWRIRMGLYRGTLVGEAARDAYVRENNGILPPFLSDRFEQELPGSVATPDRLYEFLKGYLMLADSSHRDAGNLRVLASNELGRVYPGDEATARRFTEHFQQLFADGDRLTSQPVNQDVVEQARGALRNASLALLMYSRLKLGYGDDAKRAIRLDIAAGSGAPLVLVRRSGKPLSDPVPALYTRPVFDEINAVGKFRLVKQFADDSWVFGSSVFDINRGRQLIYDVLDVYEQDYIDYWDGVLRDVMLKPSTNVRELSDVLAIVSSPASPLKGLLTIADANTSLLASGSSDTSKLLAAASDHAQLLVLSKALGDDKSTARVPGAKVAAHFAPIHTLLSGTAGQTPLDQVLVMLVHTHDQLQSVGSGVGETSALDALTKSGQVDALQGLELAAKQLPPPVNDMIGQFGVRTVAVASIQAHVDLARRYQDEVSTECQKLIAGRYPLSRGSTSDVPLEDFAQIFGPTGVFEKFFHENLESLVDTSTSPWRWRQGAGPIGGSNTLLRQFQLVRDIRDAYFKEGATAPQARFTLLPESLDAGAARFTLSVQGQTLEYRHGPLQSQSFAWPGTSTDASFNFEAAGSPAAGPALQGPWAWFRLLEGAQVERVSDTHYRITFTAGGHSMRVVLEAASSRNPFGQNLFAGFRCTM